MNEANVVRIPHQLTGFHVGVRTRSNAPTINTGDTGYDTKIFSRRQNSSSTKAMRRATIGRPKSRFQIL